MEVLKAATLEPGYRRQAHDIVKAVFGNERLGNCLTCGMCTAGCLFSDVHGEIDPRKFIRKVQLGARESLASDRFLWNCTICGRCTMDCPMGVEIWKLVWAVRGSSGATPPGDLPTIVKSTVETGNQMEVTEEEFLETVEWMEEEMREEVGKPEWKIPVNVEGAKYLFVPHPREIKFYPQDIQSWSKIFLAAEESWTISSQAFDVTNFALFTGQGELVIKILQRYADEMKRLNCQALVTTECGHGFFAFWYGFPNWLRVDYPVYHISELIADYIKTGRIKIDPDKKIDEPVTYHDPCSLARKGGKVEVPRFVISQVVNDFRDMWPNGRYNICCGGGGGALAMGDEYRANRLAKGKLKAEQIRRTGAKILIAPCHNCYDQFTDINKHYQLGLKIKHIHQIVSDALAL
jgi:Fe-S oxidoreductase